MKKNAHPVSIEVSAHDKPHFTLKLRTAAKKTIVFLACWRVISSEKATWLIQRGGMRDA
jgi:hypothetical protein